MEVSRQLLITATTGGLSLGKGAMLSGIITHRELCCRTSSQQAVLEDPLLREPDREVRVQSGFHCTRDTETRPRDSAGVAHPVELAVGPRLSSGHGNQPKHAFEVYSAMPSCFLDSCRQCPVRCAESDPLQPIGVCDPTQNCCQDTEGVRSLKETCPAILTEEEAKKNVQKGLSNRHL